jgi:hypothetical protein
MKTEAEIDKHLSDLYRRKVLELDTCCPSLNLSMKIWINRLVLDDISGRLKQELLDGIEQE